MRVLLTVDVESTATGKLEMDIWGRLAGQPEDFGVGRLMDIFDRHGAKATFFVNVYEAATHGEEALAEVCRFIDSRGHDIELHTHPLAMFGVPDMKDGPLEVQTQILRTGIEMIHRWTGRKVVAHRAGGYHANYDTLAACRQAGLMADFSHNWGYHGEGLKTPPLTINRAVVHDGILCVPVTNYAQASLGDWRSLRWLDIEYSSREEIAKVVGELHKRGVRTAVIMMHSSSLVYYGNPNRRVERNLEALLAKFAADRNIRVVTARQLCEAWHQDPNALLGKDYLPTTGFWLAYGRAWERLGEGWRNVVVAFAPIVAVLGCAAGGLYLRRRRKRIKQKVAA